ncbi:MAG: tetratricopeptide repeat protein, partial [Gammaproteobacteria bacterium]
AKEINNISEDSLDTAARTYYMGMCHFCIDCNYEIDNGQLFLVNNFDSKTLEEVSLSDAYEIAHRLLTQAANLGHRDAYYSLAIMLYVQDLGQSRQYEVQVLEDEQSTQNKSSRSNTELEENSLNSIDALFGVALLKTNNNGFNQQIHKYLLVAAKQGYMPAQFALSEVYFKGIGVEPDDIQAYAWASVAVAQNPPFGSLRRDEKATNFDNVMLNEAEALADEYMKKYSNIFENSSIKLKY